MRKHQTNTNREMAYKTERMYWPVHIKNIKAMEKQRKTKVLFQIGGDETEES